MLTKKPKQQEGYLGSGGSSEGWTKKCPDDQGDQRGFQIGKIFELLKCTIIVKQLLSAWTVIYNQIQNNMLWYNKQLKTHYLAYGVKDA